MGGSYSEEYSSAYDGGFNPQAAGSGARRMNFGSLVTEAQRAAGRVDSNYTARTKQWLNQALNEWEKVVVADAMESEEEFTVDGNADIYLPSYVRRVNWFVDKTNKHPIEREEDADRRVPEEVIGESGGVPYKWRSLGMSPVDGQPAAATVVYFDPAGAENVVCYVEGYKADTTVSGPALAKYAASEFVTCITGAETSSSGQYVEIVALGKSELTTADVTASYTSGGTTVSRIHRDKYHAEYQRIRMIYKPAAGTVIRCNYQRKLQELVDDNQILAPGVDPDYLIYKAASKIHKSMGEVQESIAALSEANAILKSHRTDFQSRGAQDFTSQPEMSYREMEDLI